MFLLLVACVSVRLPQVQTFLVQKGSSYLSSELKTKVHIGSVRLELVKKLVLKDIYVEDLHHDTLLFAEKLKVNISEFKRKDKKINFSLVELQNARVKLQRYSKEDGMNLQFIIDYFAIKEEDTTETIPWKVSADNLKLTNIGFSMRDHRFNDTTLTVDFDDIFVDSLNVSLSNIKISGDSVFTEIKNISFLEKSGFIVSKFEANAKIAPDEMRFSKLNIITPNSSIITELTFSYDSLSDFNHFLTKVKFDFDFRESNISSKDIAFFTSDLIDFNRSVNLSGSVRGTVDQLKGKNLELHFGKYTVFRGNINLNGLPNIEETFIDLVVNEMITDRQDIENIPVTPYKDKFTVKLPPEIRMLGTVRFKGKFTGFYNDFVAYGNFNTALGFISSDINLKFKKIPFYSGHILAHDFDLGKLASAEKIFGKLSLNAEVKGTHFDPDKISAIIKGNVNHIELYNYDHHNITLDAEISKKLFNGAFSIKEDNLEMNFDGAVDFTRKIPLFDFNAKIINAKLANLNLINRDTSSTLTVNTQFHLEGDEIDKTEGFIRLSNLLYSEKGKFIKTDEIELESVASGNEKHITLTSDFVDGEIKGDYRRSSLIESFESLLRKYLPYAEEKIITVNEIQDFTFNLKLKNPEPVLNIFMPSLKINPFTNISGNFNSLSNDFRILLVSDKIQFGEMQWKNITFTGKTNENKFNLGLKVNEFNFRDSLSLRAMKLNAETGKDSAFFNFAFHGKDSTYDHLNIDGDIDFNRNGKTAVHLMPSEIVLEGKNWNIDNNNFFLIDSSSTLINNLMLHSANQRVSLEGKIGSGDKDILNINLSSFELKVMNRVLELFEVSVGGVADGNLDIAAILNVPKISSGLQISNFRFLNDTLGNASFNVDFSASSNVINVDAVVTKGDVKNISIIGKYFIKSPQDELDFSIKLSKTNLQPFGHYISDFASDIRGIISAELTLKGTSSKPVLIGTARLQRASLLVDYLNTRYSFADIVTISEYGFNFNDITLNDDDGNKAILDGTILHDHFKNFGIDLTIKADKILCLNTNKTQNELFYGKAYASGVVNFSGLFDELSIAGTLTSQKGTHISIPLSNPEEVGESSFITFISKDTTDLKIEEEQIDLSGINMDFDFEATPDAEIELIFDEKIGDIMKGNGSGTIKMAIDRFGTFNMYGEYIISKGDYLFTLKNILNKRFDVEKGGTIKWNGSPYEAIIDMNAKYKLRAALYDLLQDTSAEFKKRMDVVLNLNLKNKLMNPDVSFKIEMPNIDPTTESRVKRAINSEQEVNKQTINLLVLNRFAPEPNAPNIGSSGGSIEANASEIISNQLTNWASQITDVVDVGINYRAGDNISSDELEVALSTKLFNDRVTLDGVVGVTGENETTSNTSNIVGDFNVDVQVSDNGRFHFKAFNRTNNTNYQNYLNSLYTQGIGVFYRQEFNKVGDLFKRNKEASKNKKPDLGVNSNGSK